jgi:2-C-methyl-D-erythritol 4-phosphate cytidylyltransferase
MNPDPDRPAAPGFCAVVAAAGAGVRMGSDEAKTYLPLAGHCVLEWALAPLLAHPQLRQIAAVVAPGDTQFARLPAASDPRVVRVDGGASRAASVAAGLAALGEAGPQTPVLVHDGARPCLSSAELAALLGHAAAPEGALLAVPVRDALKRGDAQGRVDCSVARAGLWQALTPQLFPVGPLQAALAREAGDSVTDEAAAMEQAGHAPRLVEGDPANIKITRPADLPLAAAVLASRQEASA